MYTVFLEIYCPFANSTFLLSRTAQISLELHFCVELRTKSPLSTYNLQICDIFFKNSLSCTRGVCCTFLSVGLYQNPGYGPWKQTSSRSITVWTQPGDSLRTEDDGSNSWKRLRSSQGHARDDDDDTFCLLMDSLYCWIMIDFTVCDLTHLS